MDLNSQQMHHDFHVLKMSETIIDNAKYVTRNASREGLVRGRTHITIIATAMYIACRKLHVPCMILLLLQM
jgi:transcription initiation factor TFIIIB Brf1 subunit/transcription initiation factor TFIIB